MDCRSAVALSHLELENGSIAIWMCKYKLLLSWLDKSDSDYKLALSMSIEPKAIKVTEKVESVPLPVNVDCAVEALKPS
jgi:hypothetical protein